MATLRFALNRVRILQDQLPYLAKKAVSRAGVYLEGKLKTKLASLDHAREVSEVFNLKGEPRPHLFETTKHSVRKLSAGEGSYVVIGVTKRGAHINFLNSGTTGRKRKKRVFFVPEEDRHLGNLRQLGSRLGGRGGIAGRYVWVEMMIQDGRRPEEKRTTGTGPKLDIINSVTKAEQERVRQIFHEVLKTALSPEKL